MIGERKDRETVRESTKRGLYHLASFFQSLLTNVCKEWTLNEKEEGGDEKENKFNGIGALPWIKSCPFESNWLRNLSWNSASSYESGYKNVLKINTHTHTKKRVWKTEIQPSGNNYSNGWETSMFSSQRERKEEGKTTTRMCRPPPSFSELNRATKWLTVISWKDAISHDPQQSFAYHGRFLSRQTWEKEEITLQFFSINSQT